MNVNELIQRLQTFAAQSPENGYADVMLQYFDDRAYGIMGANDCRGMLSNQHALVIVPDVGASIETRMLRAK